MLIAGIVVADNDVLEIARLLRRAGLDDTAGMLENAYDSDTEELVLSVAEREQILRALQEPAHGLAELRAALLAEHEGRTREGLD